MYTTRYCFYCTRARQLLNSKGVEVQEIDVGRDRDLRIEMIEKSGGRHTVPQIWIGGKHIGGSDELYELECSGELNSLLYG